MPRNATDPRSNSSTQYLAIVGDGLFVFLDDVLGTQAVLRSPNLSAGVCANAVCCEGTYAQKRDGE